MSIDNISKWTLYRRKTLRLFYWLFPK